jgi:hypothetical protein
MSATTSGGRRSRIALVLDRPVDDVGEVAAAARAAGGIDRATARSGDGRVAQDVAWGGRMQRAVVHATEEGGAPALVSEADIVADGLVEGLSRHAALVAALIVALPGRVRGIRDLSARTVRDEDWVARVATGRVAASDGVHAVVGAAAEGRRDVGWVLTHGAARFGLPDLELYGIAAGSEPSAIAALEHVAAQLLRGGIGADLSLPDATPLRLVPVLEVWPGLPAGWPGTGRAGVDRGPGLDGPRATLSLLHRPRFGRYRLDLDGVRERLSDQD